MPTMTAMPDVLEHVEQAQAHELDQPYNLIVWNDPVNLMSYVSYVFQSYFGYSESKAEKLMMQVHQDGRSTVATGSREKIESDVSAMHGFGLWATLAKADAA